MRGKKEIKSAEALVHGKPGKGVCVTTAHKPPSHLSLGRTGTDPLEGLRYGICL